MGPPKTKITDLFKYKYKYDMDEDFYLCEKCRTHITLHTQLLKKYDFPENNMNYLLFEDLKNAVGDNDHFITNKKTTVRSYYCAKCSSDLGFKLIALEEPKDEIQEGRFIVFAKKLYLWKGKLLDAVTGEEVPLNRLDGVAEVPLEEKLEDLSISEQLKRFLGLSDDQVDGMTEEPVEKIVPEAATEDPVDQN